MNPSSAGEEIDVAVFSLVVIECVCVYVCIYMNNFLFLSRCRRRRLFSSSVRSSSNKHTNYLIQNDTAGGVELVELSSSIAPAHKSKKDRVENSE